jgi:hypothetical protein
MGEFLIAPIVIFGIAIGIWLFFAAGKTSQARRDMQTLPDEPYARKEEQVRRLKAEHDEARPDSVTHPARRP